MKRDICDESGEEMRVVVREGGEDAAMEYLLDLQWTDPVAKAVARVLSALPDDVEQTTASVPVAMIRAFTVLRASDSVTIKSIVQSIDAAGAEVRIVEQQAA